MYSYAYISLSQDVALLLIYNDDTLLNVSFSRYYLNNFSASVDDNTHHRDRPYTIRFPNTHSELFDTWNISKLWNLWHNGNYRWSPSLVIRLGNFYKDEDIDVYFVSFMCWIMCLCVTLGINKQNQCDITRYNMIANNTYWARFHSQLTDIGRWLLSLQSQRWKTGHHIGIKTPSMTPIAWQMNYLASTLSFAGETGRVTRKQDCNRFPSINKLIAHPVLFIQICRNDTPNVFYIIYIYKLRNEACKTGTCTAKQGYIESCR